MIPSVPVLQPEKASDPNFISGLAAFDADLFVVVAFGQILSQKLLDTPSMGCINVHASLLPKYRGAAPMQRCLMNGEKETGVCVQKMVFQLDAGDVIEEAKIPIPPERTLGELEERLCDLSKPLLFSVIKKYLAGRAPPASPQDASQATMAPKIKAEETLIHWDRPAEHLHNLIRALSPRPGAWCWIEAKKPMRFKILRAKTASESGTPGEVLSFQENRCLVAAKEGSLELLDVQPEGKKAMSAAEWVRGCQTPPKFIK
jgi:methionyl-tRNA formyltransferase